MFRPSRLNKFQHCVLTICIDNTCRELRSGRRNRYRTRRSFSHFSDRLAVVKTFGIEAAALTQIINKKKAEIKFQFGRSWFLTSLECGNRSDIRVILWVVVP